MIDLAALIKKHSIQAHGHGTAEDVLAFAKELEALLTPDARRYRTWRTAMLSEDKEFVAKVASSLPPEVGMQRPPTPAEWDAAMDKIANEVIADNPWPDTYYLAAKLGSEWVEREVTMQEYLEAQYALNIKPATQAFTLYLVRGRVV